MCVCVFILTQEAAVEVYQSILSTAVIVVQAS
jgi:hypothetical protein